MNHLKQSKKVSGVIFLLGIFSLLGGVTTGYSTNVTSLFSISTFTTPSKFTTLESVAIDSNENVFAAGIYDNTVQKFSSSGTFISAWNTYGLGQSYMNSIYVDAGDYIWITMSGSGGAVFAKYSAGGIMISSFSVAETSSVDGFAVSTNSYIYAADGNSKVYVVSSTGGIVSVWGSSQGSADGEFNCPRDIDIDKNGYVYVADAGNSRIQKFGYNGNFITKWGSNGTNDGEFCTDISIAVSTDVYVYVGDNRFDGQRIQVFNSTGTFIEKWGTHGSGAGQFLSLSEISVRRGNVYVADGRLSGSKTHILKFNPSRTCVSEWGDYGHNLFYNGDNQSRYYSIGVATNAFYVNDDTYALMFKFDLDGNYVDQWDSGDQSGWVGPLGAAVGPDGCVYGGDTVNNKVKKWSSSGVLLTEWGTSGAGDGQFAGPARIAVSADNFVYVVDYGNSRIQKFNSTGTYISKWGASGSGDEQFSEPIGIAMKGLSGFSSILLK